MAADLGSIVKRRFFGSPFLCARSEGGDAKVGGEAALREYVVCLWFPTIWMVLTWSLIAANYLAFAPVVPLSHWCQHLAGHAVLLLTLRSYALTVHTHPGVPTDEWRARAKAGLEVSRTCERSHELLPPRARFVGRVGEVILGLDHYCFYIGGPVGHRNRAHFLQFLAYAVLLCLFGAGLCMNELSTTHKVILELSRMMASSNFVQQLTSRSAEEMAILMRDLKRAMCILALCALDCVAGFLLGELAAWQWRLAMTGRMTVDEKDDTYDLGSRRRNLRVIFGAREWLWWAPLRLVAPEGDGTQWERPRRE